MSARAEALLKAPSESWLHNLGPFRVSLPALDQFPIELWSKLVARHSRRLSRSVMAYGDAMGGDAGLSTRCMPSLISLACAARFPSVQEGDLCTGQYSLRWKGWASPLLQVLVEPTQPSAVDIAPTDGVAWKMSGDRVGNELHRYSVVPQSMVELVGLRGGNERVSGIA